MAAKNLDNLRIALEAYIYHNMARIPAEEELVATQHFSARFERRMRRLFKKIARLDAEKVAARKTAPAHVLLHNRKKLLAAAVILAILISMFSITAAREAVFSFFVRVYDSFSTIIFNRDPAESDPSTAPSAGIDDIDALLPTFIPDGYQLADKLVTNQLTHVYFRNDHDDQIVLSIQLLDMTQMMIDTEGINQEEIKIVQHNGIYYSNKGYQTIIWQDGPYAILLNGKIDKETLIKMAESTNRK
ncbi:MAG: DUF4367 domain-containing protein [Bacillota bacterium]|nr:DUF4367 domain-containing protein [Bacillota bacterium]